MAITGQLHPLLIHFPIALVIVAVVAEALAAATHDARWRPVAVSNLRAGAAFALIAVVAGWRMAVVMGMDKTPLLEWHRWLGTIGAGVAVAAAFATSTLGSRSLIELWMYRIALLCAAVLVATAGHLGGLMVWGADFLHP
jgi:uncharacterized membrane protein